MLGFVGLSSRIHGVAGAPSDDGFVTVATALGPVRARGTAAPGAAVFVAIRPERMFLSAPGGGAESIAATLRDVVFQGSKVQLHFAGTGADQIVVETAQLPPSGFEIGQPVRISFAAEDALVFPAEVAR